MRKPSEHRVMLARDLARRWLVAQAHPEHRLTIYYPSMDSRGLPKLLRSFRDARLRIGGMNPVLDLGVQEDFDSVTVWSSDRDGIVRLAAWFEAHGYETSGVW